MHQIKLLFFPENKIETCLLCNGIQPSALMNQDQIVTFLSNKCGIISSQFRSCSLSVIQIDLSFAGFKILCRWYFTIYVFCFSLFFCCCSALCFCDLSKLVYVSQLIRFCHSINNPNLIIHSPIEGHLGDFSITNRAAMNILGYISLCLRINLGVHLQLYQILPICSPKLAKLC